MIKYGKRSLHEATLQGFQVNAAKSTVHALEVTNTWTHHLKSVLSKTVVAILVLVCVPRLPIDLLTPLSVVNVGPPLSTKSNGTGRRDADQ